MDQYHGCYVPRAHGDPSSPHPRVQNRYATPHTNTPWYTPSPSNSSSQFAKRITPQSPGSSIYAAGYLPLHPAFTQRNAAALVPHGGHAFYGPGSSIPSIRSRELPPIHAQTPVARRPHDCQEGAQGVGFEKSRKFRGISAGRNQPRAQGIYNIPPHRPVPVDHCTHPQGQAPNNLFTQLSAPPQTYQLQPYEDRPPFVLPKSKLPGKLSWAWRRICAERAALLQRQLIYPTSNFASHGPFANFHPNSYKMPFYPRSMFLDDAQVHAHTAHHTPHTLDRFSRRKSRSDISSDYDNDRVALVHTKSDLVRPDYVSVQSPMALIRSTSDFDTYDRLDHPTVDFEDDYYSRDSDLDSHEYHVEYVDDLHAPKLRRRKSLKRMFDVPTGITQFFDGSRERERRYINSGGRFAHHIFLDAHAIRTGSPHVKFDILRPKDIRVVGDGYTHDPQVLDEPATFPALSKLRILVANLPWIIRVQNPNGVTLRDIADTVCGFFRTEMNPREWSMLDGAHKQAARRAFSMGIHGAPQGGLRRYECLVDTTMFMGIVRNDALVKRVVGEDAVEWTWVMLGPR